VLETDVGNAGLREGLLVCHGMDIPERQEEVRGVTG
jgi:hypothetical protein